MIDREIIAYTVFTIVIIAIVNVLLLLFARSFRKEAFERTNEMGKIAKKLGITLHLKPDKQSLLTDIAKFNFFLSEGSHYIDHIINKLGISIYLKSNLFKYLRFLLSIGEYSKRIKGFVQGEFNGTNVSIFDYKYFFGPDHEVNNTIVLFHSDKLNLPRFELRPEDVLDTNLFGSDQDIDFDSYPDFSKSYFLTGPDENAIRDLFNFNAISYFEKNLKLHVAGEGKYLMFHKDKLIKPEEIKNFLKEALLIPDKFVK